MKRSRLMIAALTTMMILTGLTGCGNSGNATDLQESSTQDATAQEGTTQDTTAQEEATADPALEKESKVAAVTEDRESFSIREISDDLYARMTAGNTFKEECIVPREDLRYLLVLHKDAYQAVRGYLQAQRQNEAPVVRR